MLKGCIAIIGLFLVILILAGCWDRMEVSVTTFPLAIGIDQEESTGDFKVFAQIVKSSTGAEGKETKTYKALEASGKTLHEALSRIADRSEQNISWKHVSAVVVTEKLAQQGLTEVLDFLSRFSQTRLTTNIIITDEDLLQLLQANPEADIGLSTPLSGVQLVSQRTSQVIAVSLKDFLIAHLTEGLDPVIPRVKMARIEKGEIQLDFPGVGVFKGDKLVGMLNRNETKGLLWVQSKTNSGSFNLTCPDNPKENISVNHIATTTRITPNLQGNKPSVTIKTRTEFNLVEITCPLKIDAHGAKEIEQLAQEVIQKEIKSTVTKAQKQYKADIFGLGTRFYRKYPHYWQKNKQKWPDIFANLEVNVEVEAKLRRTGETSESVMFQPK